MAQINGISVGIDGDLSGFNRAMADLSRRLDKLEGDFKKPAQAAGGFNEAINGLQNKLLAFASIDFAIGIGKQILDTTTEFQKLQAVLTNTLGSQEQGAIAFAKIGDFAAKTNFSVLELTDSFTKLANRGVNASTKNLQAMADVANSLGKPLESLTEAILDVSNTERWNELGIKVSKAGDMISASFRGQTVSAKATEQGALDLITAIGQFEGVAGSTAAISETLGGKVSNLGDAIDNLFFTIGQGTSGAASSFIQFLTDAAQGLTKLLTSSQELQTQFNLKELGRDAENFKNELSEQEEIYLKLGQSAKEASKSAEAFLNAEAKRRVADYNAEISNLDAQLNKLGADLQSRKTNLFGLEIFPEALLAQKQAIEKQRAEAEGQLKIFQQRLDILNKTGAFAVKPTIAVDDKAAKELQDKIAKILADTEAKLKSSAVQARIFGEEQGLLAKQTGILESSIRSLTDLGLTPQSAAVQKLVTQYRALGATDLSKLKESLQGVTNIKPIGTAQDGTLDSSIFNLPAPKIDIPKDAFDSLDQFSDGAAERLRGIQENFAEYSQSLPSQVANMFAGMADAATQGLGDFAESIGRGEDAEKALKKLVGGLASQLGSNLISLGTPLLLLPGFQGQGAAYLAAGLALKLLAGTLGAGAGKGGSSASGSQVARAEPKTGFAGGSGSDFQGSATRATQDAVRANERAQGSTQMTMIVEVTGRLTGEGSTLVAIIDRTRAKQEKTGG